MIYVRLDGSVAQYNAAEATARYRKKMGTYYCVFCDRTGLTVAYNRHCKSMMHISAKELYLKHNPAPPPVIGKLSDLPPPPKKIRKKPEPKKVVKPPPSLPLTVANPKHVPDTVYIMDINPSGLVKPPPLDILGIKKY